MLLRKIGTGNFGEVYAGKCHNHVIIFSRSKDLLFVSGKEDDYFLRINIVC